MMQWQYCGATQWHLIIRTSVSRDDVCWAVLQSIFHARYKAEAYLWWGIGWESRKCGHTTLHSFLLVQHRKKLRYVAKYVTFTCSNHRVEFRFASNCRIGQLFTYPIPNLSSRPCPTAQCLWSLLLSIHFFHRSLHACWTQIRVWKCFLFCRLLLKCALPKRGLQTNVLIFWIKSVHANTVVQLELTMLTTGTYVRPQACEGDMAKSSGSPTRIDGYESWVTVRILRTWQLSKEQFHWFLFCIWAKGQMQQCVCFWAGGWFKFLKRKRQVKLSKCAVVR